MPGVVDEHVDAAEALDDRVDQPIAVVPATDVRGDRERLTAGRLDLAGERVAGVLLAAADDDGRAALGEREAHLAPEAAAAAGDDGDLAGQVEGVAHAAQRRFRR